MRFPILLVVAALATGGCVSKSKYAELESQLKQCRERKRDADGGAGTPARGGTSQRAELVEQLRPLIESGVLEVEDIDGRTVIGMKAEVLFPSGSAELSPKGRDTVSQIAKVLARKTDTNWQVEGHTDNQPISSAQFPSNWELGAARALAVLKVMLDNGMSGGRLSAATFGEHAPVANNENDTGRAYNRRIEIVLLPQIGPRKLRKM